VVTNAHVVAGESSPQVELGTTRYRATAVLFDPKVDVAVLLVPSLKAPALRLDDSEVDRGAQGAAIGHPEGGPLTAVPAGVRRPPVFFECPVSRPSSANPNRRYISRAAALSGYTDSASFSTPICRAHLMASSIRADPTPRPRQSAATASPRAATWRQAALSSRA